MEITIWQRTVTRRSSTTALKTQTGPTIYGSPCRAITGHTAPLMIVPAIQVLSSCWKHILNGCSLLRLRACSQWHSHSGDRVNAHAKKRSEEHTSELQSLA